MRVERYWKTGANTLQQVTHTWLFIRTLTTNSLGFKPSWNQGSSPASSTTAEKAPAKSNGRTRPNKRRTPPDKPPPRSNKRICISGDKTVEGPIEVHLDQEKDDIDLVTLHNVIYYLYTGCVNLGFRGCDDDLHRYEPLPPGFPNEADPFLLYKNAKKFLIDDLAQYTFEVLRETLTPEIVVEYLFTGVDDLRCFEELVDMYVDYLVSNYEEVKVLEEWKDLEWDEAECGAEIAKFRFSLVRRIMQQLTCPEVD
jgi:hypothetical protein